MKWKVEEKVHQETLYLILSSIIYSIKYYKYTTDIQGIQYMWHRHCWTKKERVQGTINNINIYKKEKRSYLFRFTGLQIIQYTKYNNTPTF